MYVSDKYNISYKDEDTPTQKIFTHDEDTPVRVIQISWKYCIINIY